jgi:Holliday junction resolvase RusA-like endonuclease
MNSITLSFPGEPRAVQSVRFARMGSFIRKYQPKKNEDWKSYIRVSASSQIPDEFAIFDTAIRFNATFVFSIPKSMKKSTQREIIAGRIEYKTTKPDLCDNLCKGVCDALTGIVYRDDSLIAEVHSKKIYGTNPRIEITIEELV